MRHIERIHKIQYVAFQKERDQLTEEQARRKQAEGKLGKQYFKRIAAQDGELGMKMKGTHKVLAKYFHPLDDEGYRQCKLCEQIPQDQRRSQGKVVSLQCLKRVNARFSNCLFDFRKLGDRDISTLYGTSNVSTKSNTKTFKESTSSSRRDRLSESKDVLNKANRF